MSAPEEQYQVGDDVLVLGLGAARVTHRATSLATGRTVYTVEHSQRMRVRVTADELRLIKRAA
jgi:hypothetical protein